MTPAEAAVLRLRAGPGAGRAVSLHGGHRTNTRFSEVALGTRRIVVPEGR